MLWRSTLINATRVTLEHLIGFPTIRHASHGAATSVDDAFCRKLEIRIHHVSFCQRRFTRLINCYLGERKARIHQINTYTQLAV